MSPCSLRSLVLAGAVALPGSAIVSVAAWGLSQEAAPVPQGDAAGEDDAFDLPLALSRAQDLLSRIHRAEQNGEDLAQVRKRQSEHVAEAIDTLLATPGAEHSGRACTLLDRLATEAVQVEDHASARDAWEHVVAYREAHFHDAADPELLPQARHNLAIEQFQLGLYNWALAGMERVVVDYRAVPPRDRKEDLKARNDFALMLMRLGQLQRALVIQEQVLLEVDSLNPPSPKLNKLACQNLATSLLQVGDLLRAEQLMHRAFADFHPSTPEEAGNHAVLWGDLRRAQGRHDQAVQHYREAAQHLSILPAHSPNRVRAELELAQTLTETGEDEEAKEIASKVLASLRKVFDDSHAQVRFARRVLAYTHSIQGNWDAAEEHLRARTAHFESRNAAWHPDALHSRCNLASTLAIQEDWDNLEEELSKLRRLLRTWIQDSLTLAPREARERAHHCDPFLAMQLSILTQTTDEELALLDTFDVQETFRALATSAIRVPASAQQAEQLRTLKRAIREQDRRLTDLISGLDLEGKRERPTSREIQRETDRRDRLQRQFVRELIDSGLVTPAIDALALADALPEGAAAVGIRRLPTIEPGVFVEDLRPSDDGFVAFVVRQDPDDTIRFLDLGPAAPLDELIADWREAINRSVTRGVSTTKQTTDERADAIGAQIRERVIDPILQAAGPVDRLLMCLDSTLHLIPLDALPMEGSRVGDHVQILHQVSFATFMHERRSLDSAPSLLVLGDPDYFLGTRNRPVAAANHNSELRAITGGRQFGPLSGTREEAIQVAELFRLRFGDQHLTQLLSGDATKHALESGSRGVRYLHLATHGYMTRAATLSTLDTLSRSSSEGDDVGLGTAIRGLAPLNLCGIALAGANRGADVSGRIDGILSATELSSLDLTQCELAVLSACETNVGIHRSGLGIQSLQSALHAAGVRSTITSLWEVPDQETRDLMGSFYSTLWMHGASKADALWSAKKSLRNQGAPLVDWAGWTLAGGLD